MMKKFNKSLGTTKREQGILTPTSLRSYKCGCKRRNYNDGKGWVVEQKCPGVTHSFA